MPKYHTVIFAGPELFSAVALTRFCKEESFEHMPPKLVAKPGFLIIGDGIRDIRPEEILPYADQIDKEANIIITAHAGNKKFDDSEELYHVTQVSSSRDPAVRDVTTRKFLEVIGQALGKDSKARVCHRGCHSGTSLKDAEVFADSGITYYTLSVGELPFSEVTPESMLAWTTIPRTEDVTIDLFLQFPFGFGYAKGGEVFKSLPPSVILPVFEMRRHMFSEFGSLKLDNVPIDHEMVQRYGTNLIIKFFNYDTKMSPELLESIKTSNWNINWHSKDNSNLTPLSLAVSRYDETGNEIYLTATKSLLAIGAEVDAIIKANGFEVTPLANAVSYKKLDMMRILLEAGADPKFPTVVSRAEYAKDPEINNLLESKFPDPDNFGVEKEKAYLRGSHEYADQIRSQSLTNNYGNLALGALALAIAAPFVKKCYGTAKIAATKLVDSCKRQKGKTQ